MSIQSLKIHFWIDLDELSLLSKNQKILFRGCLTKCLPDTQQRRKIHFSGLRNQGPCVFDPLKSTSEFIVQDGLSKNRNSTSWMRSSGGLLILTLVNLPKKIGACKTSWEFSEKTIFGLILTVWIQI